MLSIQKRGKRYVRAYSYNNATGAERRYLETYNTKKETAHRKAELEEELRRGAFAPPADILLRNFLADFVKLYGTKRWGLSAYSSNISLIENYINPIIGDICIQDVNRRIADYFVTQLQKTPPKSTVGRKARTDTLTPCTIEKIVKLLHCAFRQAVRWDMIERNPFDDVLLPKPEKRKREIWTADTIRKALDSCTDGKLYVAINLAFACSLRLGEITGLTWDCVHITDKDIANDDAHLMVEKELARVNQQSIDALGNSDILFVFPRLMGGKSTTRLVLKKPKTESSIRRVWIPKTLALILRDWKEKQGELKKLMGEDFVDYNLVLAQENGRPCEDRLLGNQFSRLKKSACLPDVVFHSLRHSSVTYKLKLNHGNIKATQGDTGHSQATMITDLYAHILDEDRKKAALQFDAAFYANPDMGKIVRQHSAEDVPQMSALDVQKLFSRIGKNPELAKMFAAVLNAV